MKPEIESNGAIKLRGGKGRGQGRKAKDGIQRPIATSLYLTDNQKLAMKQHGGTAWVRGLIEQELARLTLEQAQIEKDRQKEDEAWVISNKTAFSNFKLPTKLDCNPNFKSNPDDPF